MKSPYELGREAKEARLLGELLALTEEHRQGCDAYRRILAATRHASATSLAELPWLPVELFKTHELASVPRERILKTLTSSGTTGQRPSRIFLDAATAQAQTRALASVMTHILGPKRLPMVILDTKSVVKDRASFSARGAGIVGMSNFGRDHFHALDDDMKLDRAGLDAFLAAHQGETVFLFGFTFMVWQRFLHALEGARPDLSRGVLVHGGGWKKLRDQAVSSERFKAALRETTGLARVHDFYGMVEQVGGIHVECEHGFLHAPDFAHVIVRDRRTLDEAAPGETGVLQVLSTLPRSYPGHSLLTHDLGALRGVDDCPCGRRGARFTVEGRVPRAELRGCSDTYATTAGV